MQDLCNELSNCYQSENFSSNGIAVLEDTNARVGNKVLVGIIRSYGVQGTLGPLLSCAELENK